MAENSKIPVSLRELLLDVYDHYKRMSRIAKNTDPDDKSFAKSYVTYTKLLEAVVDILKIMGFDVEGDDLASLLSKIPGKHGKKRLKVLLID